MTGIAGNTASSTAINVKKTADAFLNAWKLGYFYKLINATLNEIHAALKSGNVSKELYESVKEKIEALRYIANATKDNALKLKAMNNASEFESYLKKMEVLISSKA